MIRTSHSWAISDFDDDFLCGLEKFTKTTRWAPNFLAKNTKRLTSPMLVKESLKWLVKCL